MGEGLRLPASRNESATEANAERVIGEPFTFWMEHPSSVPEHYQEKAKEESRPRVICDYITGMTDYFIL